MILEKIKEANDVKQLSLSECEQLAQEIRDFLIRSLSETGGHLASNLGVVELTIALHRFLHFPEDKLVWDVGHQAYTHKILTGRKAGFENLRKYGGMSGFPKRKESSYDAFDTGHSSTSISAGLGLVKARDLKGEKTTIVSVIGDGSLTGGMAYEALNNAAKLETNFIVILNDNNMSISENVGGVSKYLNNIRTATGYLDLKEGIYNALKSKPGGDGIVNRLRRAKSSFKQLVIPGMFFVKGQKPTLKRIFAAVFSGQTVCSVVLNTLLLMWLYGSPWQIVYARLINQAVMIPLYTALVYYVVRLMDKCGII